MFLSYILRRTSGDTASCDISTYEKHGLHKPKLLFWDLFFLPWKPVPAVYRYFAVVASRVE